MIISPRNMLDSCILLQSTAIRLTISPEVYFCLPEADNSSDFLYTDADRTVKIRMERRRRVFQYQLSDSPYHEGIVTFVAI